MTIGEFCGRVAPLIFEAEGSVTSWIRHKSYNASLPGSSINSWHITGLAVDVVIPDEAAQSKFIFRCGRLGLQTKEYPTHVHVEAY